MKFMKFGGAVLNSKRGFEKMIEIVRENEKQGCFIVISAFGKATSQLKIAARTAENGLLNEADTIIEKVTEDYRTFAAELIGSGNRIEDLNAIFDESLKRLKEFTKGISITGELTRRTLDAVMSYGEHFALHIVHQYMLHMGLDVKSIDSMSVIVTDSNYGNAKPLIKETESHYRQLVEPELAKHRIILTQGFVAKSEKGETTTMGIESSNLTAVLYAKLAGEKELTIWSDVEGVRTADSKLINNTKLIPSLDYALSYQASASGLKLIYPLMIDHAMEAGIKLIYRSALDPQGESSIISDEKPEENLPCLIYKDKLTLIRIPVRSTFEKEAAQDMINGIDRKPGSVFYYTVSADKADILVANGQSGQIKGPPGTMKYEDISAITILNVKEQNIREIIESLGKYKDAGEINLILNKDVIMIYATGERAKELLVNLHNALIDK